MGPRRISAALAALALGLLLAMGGGAAASSSSPRSGHGHDKSQAPTPRHPSDGEHHTANGSPRGSTDPHDDGNPEQEPTSGGGVDAAGTPPAGVTPTPVPAPAAAVSGPAPAPAAAAPTVAATPPTVAATPPTVAAAPPTISPTAPTNSGAPPNVSAVVATISPPEVAAAGTAVGVDTAPLAAPPAAEPPSVDDPFSWDGLPQLGSLGEVAASVSDGPATARVLLASPTGRSVVALLGLVVAILLFLAVHGRFDRSDPKLAAAHSGPDVARFR